MKDLYASAIATLTAELVTLPICTARTLFLTGKIVTWNLKDSYRASIPAVSAQVFSTASKYYLYRKLQGKDKSLFTSIKNSVISGISVSLITHPLDVVKNSMATKDKITRSTHCTFIIL